MFRHIDNANITTYLAKLQLFWMFFLLKRYNFYLVMYLSKNIKHLRTSGKFKMTDFTTILEVGSNQIYKYENEKANLSGRQIMKICKLTGYTPTDLLAHDISDPNFQSEAGKETILRTEFEQVAATTLVLRQWLLDFLVLDSKSKGNVIDRQELSSRFMAHVNEVFSLELLQAAKDSAAASDFTLEEEENSGNK